MASGTLVSPPQIVQANGDRFRGKVSFTAPAADSVADYQNAVARLQVDDAAMKYRADSIEFMLPGMPEQVKAITGVSGVEEGPLVRRQPGAGGRHRLRRSAAEALRSGAARPRLRQ